MALRPSHDGAQRLFPVDGEMPALQPPHQDAWQARRAPIRIARVPTNVAAMGQIGWIWQPHQRDERVKTHRIDDLNHVSRAAQRSAMSC